ncbi:MAG: hypothetical protein RLO50_06460 [Azospirillaceae bacterium]
MAEAPKPALRVERRTEGGFLLRCAAGHAFLRQLAGPTVECPICGQTADAADLVMRYYAEERPARPAG